VATAGPTKVPHLDVPDEVPKLPHVLPICTAPRRRHRAGIRFCRSAGASGNDRARDPLPRRRDSLYNGEWRMRQNAALAHLGAQPCCSPSLAGQARQRRKSIARRFLPP
jgi:hypothetical protein